MCVKHRDKYVPFHDNQYEMTGADPLGYEHLSVLFAVIAVGIGWSAIFALCELGSSLWRRNDLYEDATIDEVPNRRRASL